MSGHADDQSKPGDAIAGWTPPHYDVDQPPTLLKIRGTLKDANFSGNFARSAKWSPDGSVALLHCEDKSFQILNPTDEAEPRCLYQPAPIVDYAWYPSAAVNNPATFCFLASVRECPIKLLDASDGRLRASYSIVDHRERQIAPHCLSFNANATKIYGGFEDAIEVFDVHRTGNDQGTRLHTTPSKKAKDGLKDQSTEYFAAGTLTPSAFNIALFSEFTGEKTLMWVGCDELRNSVSQLNFNPSNPSILYASFRRNSKIYSWDLRGDTSTPLRVFQASDFGPGEVSNQKLMFDIDHAGRWLGIGDHRGDVRLFDLWNASCTDSPVSLPTLKYTAHNDAVGSIGFNAIKPWLLSVAGSRNFDGDETESDDSGDDTDDEGKEVVTFKRRLKSNPVDASMRLWDFASLEGGP
ncbi:WD40-repeat-containing domain protein [Thelephora terrestris]|uniref:WD40-repeat-containing domain protein n=1 Tax=Thelephora terrestris TaxID=56493 RepID=A0A9P6HHL3_9AGAM|nr:WD40-repeat-containing domain protein [Thelephora terrestris]